MISSRPSQVYVFPAFLFILHLSVSFSWCGSLKPPSSSFLPLLFPTSRTTHPSFSSSPIQVSYRLSLLQLSPLLQIHGLRSQHHSVCCEKSLVPRSFHRLASSHLRSTRGGLSRPSHRSCFNSTRLSPSHRSEGIHVIEEGSEDPTAKPDRSSHIVAFIISSLRFSGLSPTRSTVLRKIWGVHTPERESPVNTATVYTHPKGAPTWELHGNEFQLLSRTTTTTPTTTACLRGASRWLSMRNTSIRREERRKAGGEEKERSANGLSHLESSQASLSSTTPFLPLQLQHLSDRGLFEERVLFIFGDITEDLASRLSSHLLLHDQKISPISNHTPRPFPIDISPLTTTTPQLPCLHRGDRASGESYEASEKIAKEKERGHACTWKEKKKEKDSEGVDSGGETDDRGREKEGKIGVTKRQKKERRKREEYEEDGEERKITRDPFLLLLNSPGGSLSAGLALVDVLQGLHSPVFTINLGVCASVASLILTAGTVGHRYSIEGGSLLLHQPTGCLAGTRTELQEDRREVKRLHDCVSSLYNSFAARGRSLRRKREDLQSSSSSSSLSSSSSSSRVFQFNEIYRDQILSSKEAQMYGLIDHIILPD